MNAIKILLMPLIFIICFLSSFIVAGHGIGSLGYLLIYGSIDAWGAFFSFGYLGLLFFVLGVAFVKVAPFRNLFDFISLLLIYVAWLSAVLEAKEFLSQLLFSAHFQIATIVWLYLLIKRSNVKELLALNVIIWPLCAVSLVQLLDQFLSNTKGINIGNLFSDGEKAYVLLGSIYCTSSLLGILFFISVYLEISKLRLKK